MSAETIKGVMIIVALVSATLITRFLPFLLFPAGKETPKYIDFLGRTLPFAAMGMLVVYCLKDVKVTEAPYGLPEAIAIIGIVLLHRLKGNSLLSIGTGTVLYMFLVQVVFV